MEEMREKARQEVRLYSQGMSSKHVLNYLYYVGTLFCISLLNQLNTRRTGIRRAGGASRGRKATGGTRTRHGCRRDEARGGGGR